MTAFTANETNANANASSESKGKKFSKFKSFFGFGTKKEERKLSWWGATWRYSLIILLTAAAITGIILGMPYAIGFIAGLGLSALWISIWTALANTVAYLVTLGIAAICGDQLSKVYTDRYTTKAAKEAAAAI